METNSRLQPNKWYTVAISYSLGYVLVYVNGIVDVANDISPFKIDNNDHVFAIGPNN